jgi:cbb3-type cytochrome oxidase maturation protein
MTGSLFLIFVGFLIWGIKSGQFKDIEEAKYQIFRRPAEDGDEPPKEEPAK